MKTIHTKIAALLSVAALSFASAQAAPKVTTVKLPYGGIRPQVAIDKKGVVHIVQANSNVRGDLVYVKHEPGETGFLSL